VLLTSVGYIRIGLRVAFGAVGFAILTIALLPHLLPPLGRTLMIVSTGNSLPSIATGSLLIVSEIDPANVAVGDLVTFRTADGGLDIEQVAATPDETGSGIRLMGYHGEATGTVSIPVTSIAGKVELALPAVGAAMTMLATTSGAVTALGILGGLMLMIWLTEDAFTTLRRSSAKPVTMVEPAH
jgi:signal peptidase